MKYKKRPRLLYVVTKTKSVNGYQFIKDELIDVTHVNEEVGVRTVITFKDRNNNTFTMDIEQFSKIFKFDCETEGE